MWLLGTWYYTGHKEDPTRNPENRYSFAKDTARGLALLRQSAALGYKPAQEKLDLYALAGGNANFAGYNAYKNGNYRLAYKLWVIGALEDQDPAAMYSLGIMALNGQMPTDIRDLRTFTAHRGNDARTAREWFQDAGYQGYGDGSYLAGEMWYREGERGPAMEWWKRAAEQGYQGASERVEQTKAEVASDVARRQADAKAYNASYEQRWEKYQKQNTNTYSNSSPTTQWGTAAPSAAQRDQDMYDKMHKEANQREKAYNDKWGR